MELLAINSFEYDEHEDARVPANITVSMTITEARAIALVFGRLNGHAKTKLGGEDVWEIYNCLGGDVFNRYWENGVGYNNIDIKTLNDPPS